MNSVFVWKCFRIVELCNKHKQQYKHVMNKNMHGKDCGENAEQMVKKKWPVLITKDAIPSCKMWGMWCLCQDQKVKMKALTGGQKALHPVLINI